MNENSNRKTRRINRVRNEIMDAASISEFLVNLYRSPENSEQLRTSKDREILRALLPKFLTDKKLDAIYYQRIVSPYLEFVEEKLTDFENRDLLKPYDRKALSRMIYASFIGFAILDINGDPEICNPTPEFHQELSRVYVEVLGSGMQEK
jgi:hypothetical protein